MDTEVEFVQWKYVYDIMDASTRIHVDSVYDVAQFLLSDKMVGTVTIKKIPVHRVVTKENNEPAN